MKHLFLLFFLSPLISVAHPGIGIVKDSKGNIYYTDLEQVWKITNGKKVVIVPHVHTHELYIDKNDQLYGEGGYYDNNAEKFYHFLWVYRGNGKIDTIIGMKQAYVEHDFSLARDKEGTEYYIKDIIANKDTTHIYKRPSGGNETVFATGNFSGVKWLHPQEDGSVLYIRDNKLYKVDENGNINLIKQGIASARPTFRLSLDNPNTWGIWKDGSNNIYVAAFSDQRVKKIDVNGNMADIYISKGDWAPLHGVFDNDNQLWVLETSDKNEIRVTKAGGDIDVKTSAGSRRWMYLIGAGVFASFVLIYIIQRRRKINR